LTRVTCVFIACAVVALAGQSLTVSATADAVQVKAAGLTFIEGPVLDRLREGRTVRLDFELAVLERPGGPTVSQTTQSFALSFDLWEERFAVTRVGTPVRSISHLRARNAEAWCLENLTIPVAALGRLGREPFWVRLAYRVLTPAPTASPEDEGFTLQGIIDRLSRRRGDDDLRRSIDAGPFRLTK
jgi:hypothetical protein